MIPDLGNYAAEVMVAYGLSILLLVGIVAMSLRRGRKLRTQLADVEARRDRANV
jgi:heme exporter protein D